MARNNDGGDETSNRRTFLKTGALGTALLAGPVGGYAVAQNLTSERTDVSSTGTDHPNPFEGRRVFKGPDANLELPKEAERTEDRADADVGIFGSNSRFDPSERFELLENNTPIVFEGVGAQEAVASTVLDIPSNQVSRARIEDEMSDPHRRFGMEFSSKPTFLATIEPVDPSGDGTDRFFRTKKHSIGVIGPGSHGSSIDQVDRKTKLAAIHKSLPDVSSVKNAANETSTAKGTPEIKIQTSDKELDDGDENEGWDSDGFDPGDGWVGIAQDTDLHTVIWKGWFTTDVAGDIYKEVNLAKITDDGDSDNDYCSLKARQWITPNPHNRWESRKMKRTIDLYSDTGHIIRKAGPSQSNETIEVGIGSSLSESGAEVNWNWSISFDDVVVSQVVWDNNTSVENVWDINQGAQNETVKGKPGYQIKIGEDDCWVGYDYKSKWKFHRTDLGLDEHEAYTLDSWGSFCGLCGV